MKLAFVLFALCLFSSFAYASNYTVAYGKNATLVLNVVDNITFTNGCSSIFIFNKSATDPIYFTFDGSTPSSGADDTRFVAPSSVRQFSTGATSFKLVAGVTVSYAIECM